MNLNYNLQIIVISYILMDLMQLGDTQTVIFDRGCLRSGEEWVERNLIPVAGVAVALAVLQVCLHSKYSVHFDHAQYVKTLVLF